MKITLPYGTKTFHRRFQSAFVKSHSEWWQLQEEVPDDLAQKLIKLTGYKGKKRANVLLHFCSSYVDFHSDCSAKSCYIIPIQSSKGWKFVLDDWNPKSVDMKVGTMIKFNDHIRHGLFRDESARWGLCIFYTVSFEQD